MEYEYKEKENAVGFLDCVSFTTHTVSQEKRLILKKDCFGQKRMIH